MSADRLFTLICNSRTRGHSLRVNCRKHFFAVRVLRIWNALPEVVSADHLTLFVRTLSCSPMSMHAASLILSRRAAFTEPSK